MIVQRRPSAQSHCNVMPANLEQLELFDLILWRTVLQLCLGSCRRFQLLVLVSCVPHRSRQTYVRRYGVIRHQNFTRTLRKAYICRGSTIHPPHSFFGGQTDAGLAFKDRRQQKMWCSSIETTKPHRSAYHLLHPPQVHRLPFGVLLFCAVDFLRQHVVWHHQTASRHSCMSYRVGHHQWYSGGDNLRTAECASAKVSRFLALIDTHAFKWMRTCVRKYR